MMGVALIFVAWATTLTISLLSTIAANPSSAIDPMAIQTRTSKAKATKADVPVVIRPCCNHTSSGSPRGGKVNAHLADINLQGSHFEGGLMVLGKDGHNDLTIRCDLAAPDSPVGVEDRIDIPTLNDDTPPPTEHARIDGSPMPPPLRKSSDGPADRNTRSSVLKNPSPAPAVVDEPPTARRPLRGLEQGSNYIMDRLNKLYIVYDENDQESRFHVEDFVGLFPSWSIINRSPQPVTPRTRG